MRWELIAAVFRPNSSHGKTCLCLLAASTKSLSWFLWLHPTWCSHNKLKGIKRHFKCGLIYLPSLSVARGIWSAAVLGPQCLCFGDGVKRKHENKQAHVNTHALAQFLTSDEARWTDSAKVRNSLPPLELMMPPNLEKHVGNFSCLSGTQGSPLTLPSAQIDLEVMFSQYNPLDLTFLRVCVQYTFSSSGKRRQN